jgi:hypothetical protein
MKSNGEGELHSVIKEHFFHKWYFVYEVPQIYPLKPEIPALKKTL